MRIIEGGCLCGAVRYRVADAFAYALICHCSLCRRATGAASKPFAGIAAERFEIVAGTPALWGDPGPDGTAPHDLRCGACGSLLASVVRDGTFVHVTLGTLDESPTIRPQAHIFAGSKAEWEVIGDDLPQFAAFPD